MMDLSELIEKWENSVLELREAERFINLLIAENRRLNPTPPENEVGATHWAVLPDESILFYRVDSTILLWRPFSKVWDTPGIVPYTLHSFDS